MDKFTTITSHAAPFPDINVDTDIIIPKQFLKTVKRTGLGIYAFNDRRYLADGTDNPDFVMNKPAYKHAQILIAGDNFGCGSSREHAVWAIMDMGIRAIIAPNFADIFRTNATKNGLLLIELDETIVSRLIAQSLENPSLTYTINLEDQSVVIKHDSYQFEIDSFVKDCFLKGLDEISLTLQKEDKINAHESMLKRNRPWLLSS